MLDMWVIRVVRRERSSAMRRRSSWCATRAADAVPGPLSQPAAILGVFVILLVLLSGWGPGLKADRRSGKRCHRRP